MFSMEKLFVIEMCKLGLYFYFENETLTPMSTNDVYLFLDVFPLDGCLGHPPSRPDENTGTEYSFVGLHFGFFFMWRRMLFFFSRRMAQPIRLLQH